MPLTAEADPFADLIPPDLIGGENGAPAFQVGGGRFETVPRAEINTPTELGAFADLVPADAPSARSMDFGAFADLVPESPTSEAERALAETPTAQQLADEAAFKTDPLIGAEKGFENMVPGMPVHTAMNAVRVFGAAAGKYIFNGLQGLHLNRAKLLEHPTPEMVQLQGDETILPDGSAMSKEQVDALERQYVKDAQAGVPDALAKAEYWKMRSQGAEAQSFVDPELAKTIPARLAHTAGEAAMMGMESLIPGVGLPLMVAHGSLAAEAEARNAGQTPAQAEAAGVRVAIGLGIFGAVSKVAGLGVARLLPAGAAKLTKFIANFVGQGAANETSSRALAAWEAAAHAPEGQKVQAAMEAMKDTTLEATTLNTVYALMHASKAAGQRAPVRPASAPEPKAAPEPRVATETARYAEPAREAAAPERTADVMTPVQESTSLPSTPKLGPSEPNARQSESAEVVPQSRPEPTPSSASSPEIMSPGPGAASAKEQLASYEQRRFGQRFQKTEGINPTIREETGNRYYEPVPNKLTLVEAGEIIDKRGTDEAIRLVRDETFAMEPRVRATLGQTLVQKLNQSHAEATAAGDATRAKGFLDQAVDTAEYLGEFGTRLGQGVQSFAIWSRLTPEGMLESAKRSAKRGGVELTPEQQAEIRRLAADAHAAPEGIPKQDATKKLADYMVQQTGIPAGDLPLSIYYTHILSGVNTHVVNAVDTALNVMHEVNNLAVSNPRAAASIYGGLMRGLGEGKYDGILSLQEGRRITSGKFIESPDLLEVSTFGKKGGVPIADTGRIARATKHVAESKFAKPLNAYKYVMRMMSASDAVWFRGAEEARAGLLAHRMTEATGVERAKWNAEVDSILGYDRLPKFREQAAKEGYTGAKAEARATELMIQSRPESLRADAADYAGVSTYNHEPRGVLGYLSNQVAQVSNKLPALKLFVPFTRIVANVTNRGLDNTPLGILRALKEKGLSSEERQRTLTRGIAGTAGIMGLGVLNATGVIQIHGAGPSDTERKRQLRDGGWKPFSLQVGDNYFTYTYTPVGLGLSVLGNYLDSQRYNELSQKDSLTRVAYSMSRIGTTVFSQSFLSGLSNLFTILSGDPGRSVNSLKQFFSSVATAATTPNLIRDVNHVFDPVARKSENIGQDLIRNIPVARLALKPTLNAFGEPAELSRNRFYSGQSDDPAWRVVVKHNLRVPVVDQTTFEDNDDGYLYAKISGERMRKYIVSRLRDLERAKPEQAQEMLSQAARRIFDGARQEVASRGGKRRKRRS